MFMFHASISLSSGSACPKTLFLCSKMTNEADTSNLMLPGIYSVNEEERRESKKKKGRKNGGG